MKYQSTKDEIVDMLRSIFNTIPLDTLLEFDQYYYQNILNRRKLGAGTFGDLALNDSQYETPYLEMPCCPCCHSNQTVKNGKSRSANQRYKCKQCQKTFSVSSNTLSSNITQDTGVWMQFIKALLQGTTVKDTATLCGISRPTVIDWRLRVFDALEYLSETIKLSGLVFADDTRVNYNFKGNHGSHFAAPRKSRTRGNQNTTKNFQKNQICVLCAIDGFGNSFSKCIGFGKPSGKRLVDGFSGKLQVDEKTVLVSDGDSAYGTVVKKYNIPEWAKRTTNKKGNKRVPAVIDDIHIQTVNGYHSRLKDYLAPLHGVTSRYLPGYLLVFDYIENHKNLSIDEQAIEIMYAMVRTAGTKTVEALKRKYCTPVSNGTETELWELKVPVQERQIYCDWINKMPIKDICAKHNIARHKIYQIRDKVKRYDVHDAVVNGVPKHSVSKQSKPISERDWDIFLFYCRDGHTLAEAATVYGLSIGGIHKVVQKVRSTPEGSVIAKNSKRIETIRKEFLPKDKIIRDITLIRNPKTSATASYAVVADMYNCVPNTVRRLYYEHRRNKGEICEAYKWKKERKEMDKESYQTFLRERNLQICRDIEAFIEAHPRLHYADAFEHFSKSYALSASRICHIYYDAHKGENPLRHGPSQTYMAIYLDVVAERESYPELRYQECFRRVAAQRGLSPKTVTNYFYRHKTWLMQQMAEQNQGQEPTLEVEGLKHMSRPH